MSTERMQELERRVEELLGEKGALERTVEEMGRKEAVGGKVSCKS